MPVRNRWIDMVMGEPRDGHPFCLRVSIGAVLEPPTHGAPVKRPSDRLVAAEFAGKWSILSGAATMIESASCCDLLSRRERVCRDDGNDTYRSGSVDAARMAESCGNIGSAGS